MDPRLFSAPLLVFALGCAPEDGAQGTDMAGHALTLYANLSTGADGLLAFQNPSTAITTFTPAEVIGKPYYFAVLPAGFAPDDPVLFETFGTVPASLDIVGTTPPIFGPGAYDMTITIYTATPVSDAQYNLQEERPAVTSGNLASFTFSSDDVLPGDPVQAVGTVRANVTDGDVSVSIANRTPTDPTDLAEVTATFEHTILILP